MKEALEAVLGLSGEIVRAAAQATYPTTIFLKITCCAVKQSSSGRRKLSGTNRSG